jgi:menaquinone-9 beta-reductase
MKHECEVLIVGGGPAGSTCAARLRQAGIDVLLIDRKTFPRDKTCAGWVTPQVMDVLAIDPSEYGRDRVCQPITGFRTGLIDGEEVATDYGRVVSYGIRRCEFDHFLLERAGVRSLLGETVNDLQRMDAGWIINGEIRASVVVGAGGHFCPIVRMTSSRANRADHRDVKITVAAQEIEFLLGAEEERQVTVRGEIPELYFCKDLAGYGWCFRKGSYLNVGLGRLDSSAVSSHVQDFCRFLRERGKVRCELPARFHGHAYRIYERVAPKLVDDGLLFIGDAAGLAYPQSGEGIRPAVESALMAADVLIGAAGDYRSENLKPYAERIVQRFGTPRSGAASDWLPAAFLRFAAARLLAGRWFTRHVVLDRWFLHADMPVLESTPLAAPASIPVPHCAP